MDKLTELDRKLIWHPFTQMKTADVPLRIIRAEKEFLYTADERILIDGISSWWVNLHGHGHRYLHEKLSEQFLKLDQVIFAGCTHEPAIVLAERLLQFFKEHLDKAFFSDNGSTAVEVALKMALQYHFNQSGERPKKPPRILAFDHAYHGDTFGAMASSARSLFTKAFDPYLFKVDHVPSPVRENQGILLDKMTKLLSSSDYAAIIYEPLLQGAGGMIMHDANLLDQVLAVCRKKGLLLIADEVLTGFGRTGRMFASEYLTNKPDLICLSKGLTGGTMPLGLTLCSQKIFDAFLSSDHSRTFFHGHSFTGNPLACALALASLDLLEALESQANRERIARRHEDFAKLLQTLPHAKNVRHLGCVLAVDYEQDQNESHYTSKVRDRLYNEFIERGVLLRPLGNVVYVLPPYITSDQSLQQIYQAMWDVFQ